MTDYTIQSEFKGYRRREDKTNLAPGYLVEGSQNVLTNEGERIQVRQGFTLDGQANTALTPILSSYDWIDRPQGSQYLRSYNDELEYRYVASDGTVTWRRLSGGWGASVNFNFAEYWDTTEKIVRLLMVNGSSNIYDWSGAVTTFASATTNTITKQGSETWAEIGVYTTGTRTVVIDGTTYTYTGGESTTTLTGVTPDPTTAGHAVGAVVHQGLRTTANSAMTGIPATFDNDLISVLLNQIYIGSYSSREVYVSAINNFTDYSFSSPRTPGEGALLNLDSTPIGFAPQEEFMYITAGKSDWYLTSLQLSADLTAESLVVQKLKTGVQQAAQSQALISKDKNSVIFVTNEPTFNTLGRIELVETPQSVNISDPIKTDFDSYDFTGGSVKYYRDFYYVAIPAENRVIMFNLNKGWWEAPQILGISRFAIIDGELYGHSSTTPETFKLFTGTSDNGNSIEAIANFSYQSFGKRANYKNTNEMYAEGYISSNTTLTMAILYELNGSGGTQTFEITGSDQQIVASTSDGSLGKQSLGKRSFAGRGETLSDDLPPKFRVIKTFPKIDFYEMQIQFSSNQVDANWQLLAYGPAGKLSTQQNVSIKQ